MIKVAISSDFLTAFSRIPRAQQKKVREFVTRFQYDPTSHSINYESIGDVRDKRVRTARIDLTYRAIILHPDQGDVYLLAWVDHHDEAMAWARNKVFEVNPVTGALQVFDFEALETAGVTEVAQQPEKSLADYALFETFSNEGLLQTGLPAPLLPAIRALKKPADLDALQPYLPAEAFEALFWIANFGYSIEQAITEAGIQRATRKIDENNLDQSLQHPDSRRRFTVVENSQELMDILNAPLEKWRIFLHPSQAYLAEGDFSGPFRVLGGAGTGKTVVAMHRAKHLATHVFNQESDRILFTTYTRNLANNIESLLSSLCGPEIKRIEVMNLHRWAVNFLHTQGIHLEIATDDEIKQCWRKTFNVLGTGEWTEAFIFSEWENVVQRQGLSTQRDYLTTSRKGRKLSLSRPQRAMVWEILEEFRRNLSALGKMQWVDLIRETRQYLERTKVLLPYRSIVVDEAQDLHPEELKLLRQMVPEGKNDLFFVGDAHQRIYSIPAVFAQCGIQIRGRARKLRINYRTTEEIRDWAMVVLKEQYLDDLDGGLDEPLGYRSLRHGQSPTVRSFETFEEEKQFLVSTIKDLQQTLEPQAICLVARTSHQLKHDYMPALAEAGLNYLLLTADTPEYAGNGIRLATMHRVKGLEFSHVLIAGVNDGILPYERADHDDTQDPDFEIRERCLLHVAASRARDHLFVSSYGKASRLLV